MLPYVTRLVCDDQRLVLGSLWTLGECAQACFSHPLEMRKLLHWILVRFVISVLPSICSLSLRHCVNLFVQQKLFSWFSNTTLQCSMCHSWALSCLILFKEQLESFTEMKASDDWFWQVILHPYFSGFKVAWTFCGKQDIVIQTCWLKDDLTSVEEVSAAQIELATQIQLDQFDYVLMVTLLHPEFSFWMQFHQMHYHMSDISNMTLIQQQQQI